MSGSSIPPGMLTIGDAAKKLGIQYPVIHGYVKRGVITFRKINGKTFVSEADIVKKYKPNLAARGPREDKEKDNSPPAKPGQMITYNPGVQGKKPVLAVVTGTDTYLTSMRTNRKDRKDQEWRNESLRSLIKKKTVAFIDPWEVIRLVIMQFAITGNRDRAIRLKAWLDNEINLAKEAKRAKEESETTGSTSEQLSSTH